MGQGRNINTIDPDKLLRVVGILAEHRSEIDRYMDANIFRPFGIAINKCIPNRSLLDTKKLMDFSFTTRQGGQTKEALAYYEQETKEVLRILALTLEILARTNLNSNDKYRIALALMNSIKYVGQKIATMFLKFLVYYSDDFEGREELVRELFIPLDSHVSRLMFTIFKRNRSNRLNLYDESIIPEELNYELISANKRSLKENHLYRIQQNVRSDFDALRIEEPPIILDYLWYVGSFYCSNRIGDIGCKTCFLNKECGQAEKKRID